MKIGFLFSGQGAQYPGMMNNIYREITAAKEVFDKADHALGRSISGLCFHGSQDELNLTHNTQPCVLASDLAACAALMSYGVYPNAVAGFSLGEFAALAVAKVLSVEETFKLVQIRADAMQEAVPAGQGGMAAVIGSTEDAVKELCGKTDGYVIPVNYNCPGQIVISGEAGAVDLAIAAAEREGLRVMKLPVSAPFHCEMMKPASDRLAEELEKLTLSDPEYPIYMNVDGMEERMGKNIASKLVKQAMSPVFWEKTLRNMFSDGIDTFVELGPGRTLSGFVKKTLKGVRICRVEDMKTLKKTLAELGQTAV